MLAFYWALFRDIPAVLRGTHEAWVYWLLSVSAPAALAIWPDLRPMTDSPWLVGVPVALSVIYGMARVNYHRYRTLQRRIGPLMTLLPHFNEQGQLIVSIRNDDVEDTLSARIESCVGQDYGDQGNFGAPATLPADAYWIDGYTGDRQTFAKGQTRHILLGSVPDRTADDERPTLKLRAGLSDYVYPLRWKAIGSVFNPIRVEIAIRSEATGLSRHVQLVIVVAPEGKRRLVREVFRDPVLDEQP